MSKQTSELWYMLSEEDEQPIKVTGARNKDTRWYPDQSKPFDPPPPHTDAEKLFDSCVRSGRSSISYSIGIDNLEEYPVYKDLLDAKSQLYKEWFRKQPEYFQVEDLLKKPIGHTREISALIGVLRSRLKSDPRIGNVHFNNWPYDFSNQFFPTEIIQKEDLAKHSDFLIKGGYWDKDLNPLGSLKNPVKVSDLYHWAPKIHLEKILRSGLLPGFITNNAPGYKNYIWAAVQEDSEWHRSLGKKGLEKEEWVMIKINYVPGETTAYYPLKGALYERKMFFDDPVFMVVRDTAISLSDMLTMQRNKDLKQIRKEAHLRRDELLESKWIWGVSGMDIYQRVEEMRKMGYGLWSYSKVHDCWIPPEMRGLDNPQFRWSPDNLSVSSTYNEVRLDYVGPEHIEIIKEESF